MFCEVHEYQGFVIIKTNEKKGEWLKIHPVTAEYLANDILKLIKKMKEGKNDEK